MFDLTPATWFIPLPFIMVAEVMPTDTSGVSATMIGQAILFLTTIVGILVQIYRENRARRWAKEDALELERHVREQAMAVKQQTETIVRQVGNNVEKAVNSVADEAREARSEIKAQLDLNTELTKVSVNGSGKQLYENQDGTPKVVHVALVKEE